MKKTNRPTESKIVFEKKALIDRNFGNACEYVTVKDLGDRRYPLTLSFVGSASGREPVYKN